MKKKGEFLLFIFMSIFILNFISAASVGDTLHLNIQTTNSTGVTTGTFKFEFNISSLSDCSNVVYNNYSTLTTDSRGIISHYLENVNLNFSEQYWLCYYRDGVLINASKIARTPYSFIAKNVSAEGVINDSNMDLTGKNITASTGFFSFLGDLIARITTLFVQDIDFTGKINGSGAINTTGNVTADTFFGDWNGSSLYAPNTTLGIQVLINDTGIYNTGNDSYVLIGSENQTTLSCSNITGSVSDLCSVQTGNISAGGGLFATNGTNVYNDTAQAFGLGDSTPTNMLDIVGGLAVRSAISDGYSAPSYGIFSEGSIDIGGTGSYGELYIYEATPNDESTIRLVNADTGGGATNGYLMSMYTGTMFKHWLYENLPMVFATNNLERLRIEADGLINISGNILLAGDINASNFNGNWNGSSLYPKNTTKAIQELLNDTGIYGGVNYWGSNGSNIYNETANVGIGTSTPNSKLEVVGNTNITGNVTIGTSTNFLDIFSDGIDTYFSSPYNYLFNATGIGIGVNDFTYLLEIANNAKALNVSGMLYVNSSSIGMGTSTPSYLLEIANNAKALNASGGLYANSTSVEVAGSLTVGDGSTAHPWNQFGSGTKDNAQITDENDVYISDDLEIDGTAYIPSTGGTEGAYWTVGDVAENMLTIESRNNLLCTNYGNCTGKAYEHDELEYGDVVCIDPRYGQVIMKCNNSETDIPVGVVSSSARLVIGGEADYENGWQVGVAGLAYTKVSNENGGIYPGDLLVLSETKPGYAMKQKGIKNMSGMILGAAYDFCDSRYNDECEIPVLIALSYTGNVEKEIDAMKKSLCELGATEWC